MRKPDRRRIVISETITHVFTVHLYRHGKRWVTIYPRWSKGLFFISLREAKKAAFEFKREMQLKCLLVYYPYPKPKQGQCFWDPKGVMA